MSFTMLILVPSALALGLALFFIGLYWALSKMVTQVRWTRSARRSRRG